MKSKSLFFIICFIMALSTLSAQIPAKYGSNPDKGKYEQVNDIKMYYEVYGEGEPLLLIHPNSGSIGYWGNQIDFFSKKYKVIVCDSRAQGRSYDSDKELTYSLMAADYNELLDKLGIDSTYCFGWSDGGIIGLELAMNYPSKIKKMVIAGTNYNFDSSAVYPELIKTIKMEKATPFNELPEDKQLAYTRLSPQPEKAPVIFKKLMDLMMNYPNYSVKELSGINTPTLVVAGDHDLIREEHTIKLFQSIPNSQLLIVPGTSHLCVMEKPDLMNQLVYEFFSTPYKEIDRCYFFW